MSGPVDPRLRRLLGGDNLASLRKRLRRRFEHAPIDGDVGQIRIDKLAAEEHSALALLAGRPQRRAASMQIDVRLVDEDLRRSGVALSLRDALERLDGPIDHLATKRRRLRDLWDGVIDACRDADLTDLLRSPAGIGLVKRLARRDPQAAAELCRRTEAVLRHLPAKGVSRSQLAADVLGDAHGLDAGQPVASLVLAVRRRVVSFADADGESFAGPIHGGSKPLAGATERARDTWARAGVLVNELARPALFLNLPARGGTGCGLRRGEPAYLSLRSLLRSPPEWDVSGREVFVCENPNLIAIAADRWGAGCAPMVCTDGMPAAAQRCLLSQLAEAGAELRYHGDFDWPGLRIANHVMREHAAQPWRFGASDYIAAVQTAPGTGQALKGTAVEASWDGALTSAMQHHLVAIDEEAVAAALLQDLCAST